jgi:guanidinopropionase
MSNFNQPFIDSYNGKFAGICTLMRLPIAETAEGLDVALFGVPFDMGTFVRPGARLGPTQIREKSRHIRSVNPATGISPFDMVQCADLGDAPCNPMNYQGSLDKIEAYYIDILKHGAYPLAAGGDHTIPLLALRAMRKAGLIDKPISLIHIDAHSDVLKTEGGVFEGMEVNHATFARLAIEEGLVDPKRTIQIGLRGSQYSLDANSFASDSGVRMVYQHEFDEIGVDQVCKEMIDLIDGTPVYFSIDVDGLDPTVCPGTGYPEPGGLTMREMQKILRVCQGQDVIGADVCEVSPPFDVSGNTALVGAHLMFEQLCLMAEAVARRKGRIS